MLKTGPPMFFFLFLIAVAVFGFALVPFLMLQPNLQADQLPFRQQIVGALYLVVCVLGVSAVFYPGKCRLVFQKPRRFSNSKKISAIPIKGHHPDCEKFSANRVKIRGSVQCGACTGLLVGAIVASIGISLFSFGFFDYEFGSIWAFAAGGLLMLLGLAQIKMKGYVKLAANALFVIGSCISLISVDLAGQNFIVDLYMLALVVFMLWFRILLSEWNNERTCIACGSCV